MTASLDLNSVLNMNFLFFSHPPASPACPTPSAERQLFFRDLSCHLLPNFFISWMQLSLQEKVGNVFFKQQVAIVKGHKNKL